MKGKAQAILLLLLLAGVAPQAAAQPGTSQSGGPLLLDAPEQTYRAARHLVYLEDRSGGMEFEQARDALGTRGRVWDGR